MESCGMTAIKYILFFFNIVFAMSGVSIISAGTVVITDVGGYSHFLEGRILAPPIVLIVAGSIVFFIAFFGCYGAIKESYCMLMTFAVLLLLIFIVEMAVGVAAAVYKNDFAMILKDSMKKSMMEYTEVDKTAWDNVQEHLNCCGVESPSDWSNLSKAGLSIPGFLPPSCCKDLQSDSQCRSYDLGNVRKTGCYAALEEKVQQSASVLIGVGTGIAIIEIAGIVLACCLAITVKKEEAPK